MVYVTLEVMCYLSCMWLVTVEFKYIYPLSGPLEAENPGHVRRFLVQWQFALNF